MAATPAGAPVIRSEGLSKRYRIRHDAAARYKSLREAIGQSLRGALGSRGPRPAVEDFWALDGVDFEVARGEVVGIVGRNGAGKSTLLKILSRITEPSRGRVVIEGRVASLLEVGTGFHPELTGRENVFLNGAILGMTRAEIRARFDAIVDFAEVERFLDTPVKRYSSGMYVRLAFAVAAHLEPEILIVDEVLAVGDAAFQKKCLGKMQEVSTGGRTVLFVSHNMAAIQNLCSSALLLSAGRVAARGAVGDVVRRYLEDSGVLAQTGIASRTDRRGSGALRVTGIVLRGADGVPAHAFASGGEAVFEFTLAIPGDRPLRNVRIALGVDADSGQRLLLFSTHLPASDLAEVPPGTVRVELRVPRLALAPGRYGFAFFCSVGGEVADWVKDAGSFEVVAGRFYRTGEMPPPTAGYLLLDHEFTVVEPR
jgi:lipopolysaccharide transport system ATP-binding protein